MRHSSLNHSHRAAKQEQDHSHQDRATDTAPPLQVQHTQCRPDRDRQRIRGPVLAGVVCTIHLQAIKATTLVVADLVVSLAATLEVSVRSLDPSLDLEMD